MTPKVYGLVGSPPYAAVLMCAKVLGVKLDFEQVNLVKGEQFTEDFLKKNPQHTVPLLEDDGYLLADSHAINGYLVGTYGKENDPLYPRNDIKRRALIDHRLHLDSSIVAAKAFLISRPLALHKIQPSQAVLDGLREAFVILDRQIKTQNSKYMVGDELSIADFSVTSTVTIWGYFVKDWEKDFPHINDYIERMRKEDWFDFAVEGSKAFNGLMDLMLTK